MRTFKRVCPTHKLELEEHVTSGGRGLSEIMLCPLASRPHRQPLWLIVDDKEAIVGAAHQVAGGYSWSSKPELAEALEALKVDTAEEEPVFAKGLNKLAKLMKSLG